MPSEIASALLNDGFDEWSSRRALARIEHEGREREIPGLAAAAAVSMQRVAESALDERLTLLGMTMAPNRPPAETRAWLRETARLLGDLPQDILFDAIDECQRTMKFLPTVAEVRAIAEPRLARRRRTAFRLDAIKRAMEKSGEAAAGEPSFAQCTPDDAAAIRAEFGLETPAETRAEARHHLGPPSKPTRQDYIETCGMTAEQCDAAGIL